MSKVWRRAALAVFAVPGAAFAAAAQSSVYPLPNDVALNVTGGPANSDGSGIQSSTSVALHSPVGSTTLSGAFTSAPPDPSIPADRTDRKLGLDTKFNAPGGVNITVQASSETQDVRQTGALLPGGLANSSDTTKTDSALVSATTQPMDGVGLTAGVSKDRSETTQGSVAVDGSAQRNTMASDERSTFASATWSPLSFLQLEAGADSKTTIVSTHGQTNAARDYRHTAPHASATASLWDGAQAKLSGADVVSAVNPYDFAALVQASGDAADAQLKPNREWQNQATLTQNFDSSGTLSATVTQARIESATELGIAPSGAPAPMSVSGGTRRELDASLSMPLARHGLPGTTITSQATLRQSRVRDPVTGQMRRLSGEVPRQAGVTITHKDDRHHLQWGVKGSLATEQRFYQPSQVTALRTDPGVGAFVTYDPGKYTVSLNADGLIGGGRSQIDTFYSGTRNGNVIQTNRSADNRPLVSLSVSQKF